MPRTGKKVADEGHFDFDLLNFHTQKSDKTDINLLDIEIDVHDNCFSESNDDDWGLHDEDEFECPRTPASSAVASNAIHQIPPVQVQTPKVVEPNLLELRTRYQKCIRKLATSMRQTDLTRGIVKRQKTDNSFFASSNIAELEASRRNIYQWINSTVHCSP